MEKEFNQQLFETTFNKHKKLLREAHFETSPRDEMGRVNSDEIKYTIEKSKGEINKIIADLSGKHSEIFTKTAIKLKQIAELEEEIEKINDEIKQEAGRDKIFALFGAEFEFVTRVINTVSGISIMLTKQPKAAETKKYEAICKELYTLLDEKLKPAGDAIIAKHTTIQPPKPPSLKLTPVKEGIGSDIWNKFLVTIKKWGKAYDTKLNSILNNIETLDKE